MVLNKEFEINKEFLKIDLMSDKNKEHRKWYLDRKLLKYLSNFLEKDDL